VKGSSAQVIGVSRDPDTLEDVRKFHDRGHVGYALVFDEGNQLWEPFEIADVAGAILVDRNGIIRFVEPYEEGKLARTEREFRSLLRP
jgi:peroxiredoxin